MVVMARQTMAEVDEAILSAAATQFARHGFKYASLQRVADAVGYSKTGLLHHFATKDELYQAVMDRATRCMSEISVAALEHQSQTDRDHAAIDGLTDLAVRDPGLVLFMLTAFTSIDLATMSSLPSSNVEPGLSSLAQSVVATFGLTQSCENQRFLRVVSVLGAVSMSALVMQNGVAPGVRDELAAIARTIIDSSP